MFTHFPMCNQCDVCLAAKILKATRMSSQYSTGRCDALPKAEQFGDRLTADHAILNEENKSAEDGNLVACINTGRSDRLASDLCL